MESINKSAVVPYSAEQMYTLVNDVSSYPAFLPWCSEGIIHEQSDTHMKASVSLSVGAIEQSFTTKNTLTENQRIDVQLVSGPFRELYGYWLFEVAGENSCRISFQMNFEYKNRLIKFTLNRVFQKIGDSLVNSFVERARDLYGR